MSGQDGAPGAGRGQGNGLRVQLRAATAGDHARLDALGARFDLATPHGYAAYLSAHAALVPGLEGQLAREPLPPDWPSRCRAAAVSIDLASLGVEPSPPAPLPQLETAAMRIGALYVLEGSRLGGAVLLRQLRAAQPGVSCEFLKHGSGQALWPRFLAWFDGLELDDSGRDAATEGARRTFKAFEHSLHRWASQGASQRRP